MREEIKQTAEAIASHPKTSLVITAAFTSNAWIDFGEPIIRGVTTIAGMFVVIFLAVKHFLDLRKEWRNSKDKPDE